MTNYKPKTKNKSSALKEILKILITIIVLTTISVVALNTFGSFKDDYERKIIYIKCCNSSPCSDTYYTVKDNLCHLVLCENNILILNKSVCIYEGADIDLITLGG